MTTYLTDEGIVNTNGPTPNEAQVRMARVWLRSLAVTTVNINKKTTSYGWKHVAEKVTKNYISNGAFIQAAMDEGLKVKHIESTQNAYINLSELNHGNKT